MQLVSSAHMWKSMDKNTESHCTVSHPQPPHSKLDRCIAEYVVIYSYSKYNQQHRLLGTAVHMSSAAWGKNQDKALIKIILKMT